MFRRVKGHVWCDETWSLARSKLTFRTAKPYGWENEEWWMESEELVLTDFNLYFITFPRQVFVGIFPIYSVCISNKIMPKAWKNTGRRWSAKHGTPAKHTSINGTPKGWQILCRVAREGNAVVVWLYVLLQEKKCRRHWTMVASHTEKPLGFSNQRSLFAKRGKVNGWIERHPHPEPCCR